MPERRRKLTRLTALGAAVLGVAAAAAPAQAALSVVGPMDPATKAPAFYQDANGLQLGLCHPGTVNCGPAVPGEDFYNMATSTLALPNGGTALLILDMTLAPNASGDPAAFNRVRIQIDGAPAGTYNITHPYGTDTVTVASAGARGRTTIDIGCAVTAVGLCDFATAMGGRYGPFLTAAPGTAVPAGFIGDAVTEVPVVGSPTGNNFFRVEGPGLPAGGTQSNTFALMGKLFGGAVPAFTSSGDVAFADQLVGSAATTKTVTVTSAGIPGAGSNLTVKSATLGGANSGDYSIASNTCTAAMPSGSSCSIGVSFAPGAAGTRSATLTIADNTAVGSHVIALNGKGTTPAAPAAAPVVAAPAPKPLTVDAPVLKPLALSGLRVPSRLKLRVARHAGIVASFTTPSGANVARIRLLKAGVPVASKLVALDEAGRQVVHLRASRAHAGRYVLEVKIGAGASSLTAARTARVNLVK